MAAGVCVLLVALVWVVFGQTFGFDFVNYDDPQNVYENAQMTKGLDFGGVVYAFTHTHVGHWNPLTTLSHMLVNQIWGRAPGGHHMGNVLLHGAAAILLFLVLWQMTLTLWRSAFVAAVFAIHPLRVESVAWVTERKDVLSGVFFMLTLAAYLRYVRRPSSTKRYMMVVVLFSLGLMSKSMLVTLPFVLFLLDYWPLSRFPSTNSRNACVTVLRSLVREKIPLLILSVLAALIQLIVNQDGIVSTEKMSVLTRAGNALVSYAIYVGQLFYPANLTVFYPHPGDSLPVWQIVLSTSVLIVISAACYVTRKSHLYLICGWLWYLGMLIPVIGLVQSGELARADRYTYLPQIGLLVAFTWMACDLCARVRHGRFLLASSAAAAMFALALSAHRQTRSWKDGESLWKHAIACDSRNYLAFENLAGLMELRGRTEQAIEYRRRSITIKPDYEISQNNLGLILLESGRTDEAIQHFQQAIDVKPRYPKALNNLGTAYLKLEQFDEAIGHFQKALEIKPDYAVAAANLGSAYFRTQRLANAIVQYQKAVEIAPDYVKAHANLGHALLQDGRAREAVSAFERALALQPDYPLAQNNLAWVLATHPDATLRDGPRAVTIAQQVCLAHGEKNVSFYRTLAAAYAAAGSFDKAVETANKALELSKGQANPAFTSSVEKERNLYESRTPLHESQ